MANNSITENWQTSHHTVVMSYFKSADAAQIAIVDLVAEGMSEQDFTLLNLSSSGDHGRTDSLEYAVSPFAGTHSYISDDNEDSADRESEVGGGIATSSPDDDVSSTQEMDDSESAAEDSMYPVAEHSIGDEEARDVAVAAKTGFFETTLPGPKHQRASEAAVVEVDLPGLGTMIGEGSFGTQLLDLVFKEKETSLAWLTSRLNRRDRGDAIAIGKQGALLAIDVNPTSPNPDRIEEVLQARGAAWVRNL